MSLYVVLTRKLVKDHRVLLRCHNAHYFQSSNVKKTRYVLQVSRAYGTHVRTKKNSVLDSSSSFDLFQNLKSTGPHQEKAVLPEEGKKRKPSDRVIRLAEQVLSLTLVEAADLCELCQEALQTAPSQPLPHGRSPFPHPGGYFAGAVMPSPMPVSGAVQWPMPAAVAETPTVLQASQTPVTEGSAASTDASKDAPAPPPRKESKTVAVRLEAFNTAKKIALVREVKSILGLGLKEAKDTVEGAPNILKQGVLRDEANEWKEKLEAAGATILLE